MMNLHRIELGVFPFNDRAIHIYEKLGFQKEGYSPKFLSINGNWEDHIRFAKLNESIE